MAAHMAGIRVGVMDDDMPCWVRRVLAIADQPLAGSAALHAGPLAAGEVEVVALLEKGPVSGERLADRGPLVLLGGQPVVRLRLAPALRASVVFAEVLDVVSIYAADFFDLSLQVWNFVFVALSLLLGDSLEVLAFSPKVRSLWSANQV